MVTPFFFQVTYTIGWSAVTVKVAAAAGSVGDAGPRPRPGRHRPAARRRPVGAAPVDALVYPRFSGIATFMRLPHVTSAQTLDIALIGERTERLLERDLVLLERARLRRRWLVCANGPQR